MLFLAQGLFAVILRHTRYKQINKDLKDDFYNVDIGHLTKKYWYRTVLY